MCCATSLWMVKFKRSDFWTKLGLWRFFVKEKLVSINPVIFQKITDDIALKGAECSIDNKILNYMGETIETDIGQKLYSYLEELCNCSELHMNHVSEPLPTALTNLKESIVKADLTAGESLTII